MEEEELQKAVYAYLRKKGFRQTVLVLQEEQNRLSSSAQSDLAVSRFIQSFLLLSLGPILVFFSSQLSFSVKSLN